MVWMNEGRPRRVPTARGADFNAFGYDPEGALAHLASHLYGPSWKPSYTVRQLVGAAEPPRYGPPAPYQEAYLPADFRPTTPPLYYGRPAPPFIRPPIRYNPNHYAALLYCDRLRNAMAAVRRRREAKERLHNKHAGAERERGEGDKGDKGGEGEGEGESDKSDESDESNESDEGDDTEPNEE